MACAEPFEETRQDLRSFRVAAVGVQDQLATAAIWSGEGLFHTAAPTLDWTLNGQPIGSGWQVPVVGYGTLGLTATAPDGTVRSAQVTVQDEVAAPLELAREAVDLSGDLGLDARRALVGAPLTDRASSGSGVRLVMDGRASGETLRWMLGGGVGTLLELNADQADVLRAELTWEDGVVTEREELGDGAVHALVLAIDGGGGNRWLWADALVGDGGSLARHEGRLVPVSGDAGPGLRAVTLVGDPGDGGLGFGDAVPVDGLEDTDSLDCAPDGEPFRLAWVAEGRCVLDQVLGARVVVETW